MTMEGFSNDMSVIADVIAAEEKQAKSQTKYITQGIKSGNIQKAKASKCKKSPTKAHYMVVTGAEQHEKCKYCEYERVLGPVLEPSEIRAKDKTRPKGGWF